MDLLQWAGQFSVPTRTDARSRKVRFAPGELPLPSECTCTEISGAAGLRRISGEAISIDSAALTATREGYRALGIAAFGYALSPRSSPLRIHLSGESGGLRQVVFWPGASSKLETLLGCRLQVSEVHYRSRLAELNPNYSTVEQDEAGYPREHLPYCSLGPIDGPDGLVTPGDPMCLHIAGTAPSVVWLGKFLLDLALENSNRQLAYLYNYNPSESLAPGSAELRLLVSGGSPPRDDGS